MDNNVFTVKNLSFAYGKQQVLKHLDLELHEGKITTLIGANGCGKSTLFNLMTKNLRPDEGGQNHADIDTIPYSQKCRKSAVSGRFFYFRHCGGGGRTAVLPGGFALFNDTL